MKDYKVQQYVYNRLNQHDDVIGADDYIYLPDQVSITKFGSHYFTEPLNELIYPAKSFSVAIIYAHLIQKNFGTDFYESLDDADLLCGNDKFYCRYSEAKESYDFIINEIDLFSPDFELNMFLEQVEKTVSCFYKEFNLEPNLMSACHKQT